MDQAGELYGNESAKERKRSSAAESHGQVYTANTADAPPSAALYEMQDGSGKQHAGSPSRAVVVPLSPSVVGRMNPWPWCALATAQAQAPFFFAAFLFQLPARCGDLPTPLPQPHVRPYQARRRKRSQSGNRSRAPRRPRV